MATIDHLKTLNSSLGAGITKENQINLNRLVNLALNSSPKVGIVNFNILKTFLLELLKVLNIQNYEPKFGDDIETRLIIEDALLNESEQDSISALIDSGSNEPNSEKKSSNINKSSNNGISLLTSDLKPITFERFHKIEDKLARLEQQISSFNSLPSNQQIIDKSKEIKKLNGSSGPILEIWQYTQLSKRLELNEDGITKLTSLLQDLIGDINDLKEGQNKNSNEIENLNKNYKSLLDRFNEFEKIKNNMPSLNKIKELEDLLEMLKNDMNKLGNFDDRFKNLEEQINYFENQMITLVRHPDLELYVTWNALESSLKGIKDALDSAVNKPIIISEQRFTQTTPLPPLEKSKTPMPDRAKTPLSTNENNSQQPSAELQELLNKLGTLNDRHENLKSLVEKLQLDLLNIPRASNDSSSYAGSKLPDDFIQKLEEIKNIKAALEELKDNFTNETNKRMHFEHLISNLNIELYKIRSGLKECLKNTQLNKDEIESLKEAIRLLEDTKADKEWIKSEFERKADKRDLDQRVHKKVFEDTCQGLSNNLNSCLQKQTNLEEEYKTNSENIFKELENKLDKLELDSLKKQIDKQLKLLRKIQKDNVVPVPQNYQINAEDDAAGLRKQLLRFHCISCDRPIEMNSGHIPLPSLPAEKGIRPIQTPRPYTTYELNQIREYQKQQLMHDHPYDLFASVRQCGGPHTLTVPHRKLIKMPTANEEPSTQNGQSTTHKSEVQIQGQDGNIYKGRIDAKLTIEMKKPVKYSSQSYLPPKSAGYNLQNSNILHNHQLRPQSSHTTRFSTTEDKTVTDDSIQLPLERGNLV